MTTSEKSVRDTSSWEKNLYGIEFFFSKSVAVQKWCYARRILEIAPVNFDALQNK